MRVGETTLNSSSSFLEYIPLIPKQVFQPDSYVQTDSARLVEYIENHKCSIVIDDLDSTVAMMLAWIDELDSFNRMQRDNRHYLTQVIFYTLQNYFKGRSVSIEMEAVATAVDKQVPWLPCVIV